MTAQTSAGTPYSDPAYPGKILEDILEKKLAAPIKASNFIRVKGGFSREIWAFDATSNNKTYELILCKDGGNGAVDTGRESLSRVEEFQLLKHLKHYNNPVPEVICAGNTFGSSEQAYLIMARVAGETDVAPLINDPYYKTQQQKFSQQMATMLATIHRSPICKDLFPTEPSNQRNIIATETERWCSAIESMPGALTPSITKAIKWLKSHMPPPPEKPVLVHGDFRVGNMIYGKEGIRTVLDWEMAHIGDPLEDVAWAQLCTWTGKPGGLVDCDAWFSEYTKASGQKISHQALKFWDVISIVKMTGLAFRAASKSTDNREIKFLNRLIEILRNDLDSRLLKQE
ncbi:MAG: phosphotransferase family protein [Spongiibacteraceae bacterium]